MKLLVSTTVIFVIFFITLSFVNTNFEAKQYDCNERYIDWVMKHSNRISRSTAIIIVDAALSLDNGLMLLAVAKRESNFSPTAVSSAGAVGLNQIMPNIWTKELKEQGVLQEERDLFDPVINLKASNYILTKYYKSTGSWEGTLKKYVGGRHKTYIKDIFSAYGKLMLLKNGE